MDYRRVLSSKPQWVPIDELGRSVICADSLYASCCTVVMGRFEALMAHQLKPRHIAVGFFCYVDTLLAFPVSSLGDSWHQLAVLVHL